MSETLAIELAFEAFWEKECTEISDLLEPRQRELFKASLRCAYFSGASYGIKVCGVAHKEIMEGNKGT